MHTLTHIQLQDVNKLHELVGNVIYDFIDRKKAPFLNATLSKQNFWRVPSWKRAMIFVSVSRYIIGMSGQMQWKKFCHSDYKFNVRMFKRWIKSEKAVMVASSSFSALSETASPSKIKWRKKNKSVPSSPSGTDSPMKKRCVVADESTDED